MKKPSIDAIRRFKEQQELKKLEETERKIQEKLITLEHRAAQGDRKAKSELKIIEKAKEERSRQPEKRENTHSIVKGNKNDPRQSDKKHPITSQSGAGKKPKRDETDFEELMRLAASNNNQVRREQVKQPSPPPQRVPSISRKPQDPSTSSNRTVARPSPALHKPVHSQPSTSRPDIRAQQNIRPRTIEQQQQHVSTRPQSLPNPRNQYKQQATVRPHNARLPARSNLQRPPSPRSMGANYNRNYHSRRYEEDEDEDDYDDYEQDDFVVDEDDAETQDEVSKTIRSVFGYDKRRCDLREAELDRQYRQIGRVSTFEDLEREERRASRLAAVEDARALRDEEERKRLKKIRLKGH